MSFLLPVALCVTIITLSSQPQVRVSTDWATTPEAYFLTPDERQQWKALRSDEAREEFRNLYWRRRDPTPGTDRNEFKEAVLARIRNADAQFSIGKVPGSKTAEGFAYVVFGPPSARKQTMGPLKNALEMVAPGQLSVPREAFATTEWHTWTYDRDTRGDLLAVVGVPSLEISFIIEPGRRDELQSPGRVKQWAEMVARHSIASK